MKHNVRKAKLGKPLENPRMEARARRIHKGNLVRLAPHMLEYAVGELVSDSVGVVINARPKGWNALALFTATTVYKTKKVLAFGFYEGDLELVKR